MTISNQTIPSVPMPGTFRRTMILLYGGVAYAFGVAALLYLIAFTANLGVFPSIDHAPTTSTGVALAINLALISLFGLQHSIMARQSFKRIWTRLIPEAAERSTYLIATGAVLVVFFWQWRAMPTVIWSVESNAVSIAILATYFFGWALVFLATFLIDHFELFGLKQVWSAFRGRSPADAPFQQPWLYRFCRHPMQLGVLIAVWAAPTMTVGRLVFAAGMTAYIFVGLYFEERDLIKAFGARYTDYVRQVPKLIPNPFR